jgi:hypothetical protein
MSPVDRATRRTENLLTRLNGGAEKGPSRGRVRKALVEDLFLRSRDSSRGDADVLPAIQREAERRWRGRDAVDAVRNDPMQWALRLGRQVGYRMASWELARRIEQIMSLGEIPAVDHIKAKPLPIAGHPMIDIRFLAPQERRANARRLAWYLESGDRLEMLTSITGEADNLELWIVGGPQALAFPTRQVIKLAYGEKRRDLFMLCPVTGKRCLKLYFRNGAFASREAQHLTKAPAPEPFPKAPPAGRSITYWQPPLRIPRRRVKTQGDSSG